MQKLRVSGSRTDTTLGANETSQVFYVTRSGRIYVYVTGTYSAQTLTLQFSPDNSANSFVTLAVDLDGSAVAVNQTWTGAAGEVALRSFFANDMFFRVSVSNGGSPSLTVYVSGDSLHAIDGS